MLLWSGAAPGGRRALWRRAGFLVVAGAWLGLDATLAAALPLTFRVDYVTNIAQSCSGGFCTPLGHGPPFQKTFVLDDALLAVDGSYDVSASLDPPFTPTPATTSSYSLSVTAEVMGGSVVDLVISLDEWTSSTVPFFGTRTTSQRFDAALGTWSSSASSDSSLGHTSTASTGTYRVRAAPEAALGAAWLALGWALSRPRSRYRGRGVRAEARARRPLPRTRVEVRKRPAQA